MGVWKRRKVSRPKEGHHDGCPFLNTAGDAAQWDPRTRETRPPFRPSGFSRTVSPLNPSWEAFSLVSRVSRGSGATVRILGSPSNSHRDIPSLNVTPQVRSSTCQKSRRVPPFPPNSKAQLTPQFHGVFPFAAPPPRRGHNGKLSFLMFEYGRD